MSVLANQANAASKCVDALSRKSLRVIKANNYTTTRGLDWYAVMLGEQFIRKLESMDKNSHWLDAGAGAAAAMKMLFYPEYFLNVSIHSGAYSHIFAKKVYGQEYTEEELTIQNYFRKIKNLGRRKTGSLKSKLPLSVTPYATAVTYQRGEGDVDWADASSPKLKRFIGRLFEDIPESELTADFGQVDLITDIYGVFAYTADPSAVLEKYLSLLKDDGEIHILVGELIDGVGLGMHELTLKSGKKISLIDWLLSLEVLDVQLVRTSVFGILPRQSVVIKKKAEAMIHIPKLKLIDLDDRELPPIRFFKEQ